MNPFQKALFELRQRQQLLATLIFALVAIFIWIAVSLVGSQRSSGIARSLRVLAEPLTPTINRQVIEQLENELVFDDSELSNFPIFTIVTDTEPAAEVIIEVGELAPEASESIEATTSGEVETTPESTTSGETTSVLLRVAIGARFI